ncbi:MAG: leucine-rich repeat protein, partial [Eubacterium sp.]
DGTYSNYMTPQGVCVAGSYILITAYDGINDYYKEMGKTAPESKKNSVIYVLDKKTNKYLTTVVLNSKCHVGGISYNQKAGLIYVADSDNKQICMLNYSDIVNAVNSRYDAVKVEFSKCIGVNVNPSFVTYYGGYVYVGNFVEKKENEKNSILKAYNPITLTEISNSTIKLPLKSQGVAFITYDNQLFMAVSCSHGRKNKSQVFAYRMKKSGNVLQKVSEFDWYKFPEMTEDICVYGDKFLTCYESAAAKYQNDNSPSGKCANPIDRITANSISKVAESYYGFMSLSEGEPQDNEEEFESVVLSGSCGEDAEFVLYSNGLFNITGQGRLYDYAENEAPWSDYSDSIAAVAIAPDIDSIGENSFVSCNNLEYIAVSEFSDINETFTISSNAFVDCNAIDTVILPDKSIDIADDAFKDSSTQMTIISDSQDAIDYAEKNNLYIHNHNYRFVKTIAPTCGSNGYDLYQCSCGSEDLRNVTEATSNHDYVLSDDTHVCLAGETQLYTCTKCQTTYDVELTEDCHSFTENVVAPTYEQQGYTEYTCTVCGYTYTGNYVDRLVTPTPDPTPSPTPVPQPTPTQPVSTQPAPTTQVQQTNE